MMLSIIFLIANIFFFLLIIFLTVSFVTGGPFVPSRKKSVETMIKLAHLKPGMRVYDLGSGDGRIIALAKKCGVRAIGIEINPYLVLLSRLKGLEVRWQNLWTANISDADVVFIYLLPFSMKKLRKILHKQLKPGALVITNTFIFHNWKIEQKDEQNHIYAFRVIK